MAQTDPPRRRTEIKALAVAALVIGVVLALFLVLDGPSETSPTVSEGGEDPATAAPYGVEPAEPAVD